MPGRAVSLLVLGACGFRSSGAPGDARPPDAVPPDAAPAFCDPADPHLMACYELDGDASDGSSHHLDATLTDVAFEGGQAGEAMRFGPASGAAVADSPVFDISTLTIETWIRPSELPASGSRAGVIDVDKQYGLFVFPDGALRCTTGGGPTVIADTTSIAVDHWTHVACTYDGSASILYVDGSVAASSPGGGTPSTAGTTGMSIAADNPGGGDRLSGLIDQLRLMDVALPAARICADAGRPSCP